MAKKRALSIDKVAASVHIACAAEMTPAGRRRIAAWMIEQADYLTEHGKRYAGRFRARYFYTPKGSV